VADRTQKNEKNNCLGAVLNQNTKAFQCHVLKGQKLSSHLGGERRTSAPWCWVQ